MIHEYNYLSIKKTKIFNFPFAKRCLVHFSFFLQLQPQKKYLNSLNFFLEDFFKVVKTLDASKVPGHDNKSIHMLNAI